jgi:predicted metal-binding membrane protein
MRIPQRARLLRPKLVVAVALMFMTALAWLLLTGQATPLSAMHGHARMPDGMAQYRGPAHWFAALFMWLTMTVAMMLPTAAPAILSYADSDAGATARAALRQTGAFAGGYLVVWSSFGVLAISFQWLLSSLAPHGPLRTDVATALAGCLLVLAGLYQFSSTKRRCLAHCRDPLGSSSSHWHASNVGGHLAGMRHGFHCLGCCWALMVLMLLGGAMNIGWTAALAGLMFAEKILPRGLHIGRVAGIGLIGWGSVLIAAL